MVQLDATLRDLDTVGTWLRDYNDALAAMGGKGVALGTDFNGLSPQMPFAASPVPYPMPKPYGAPTSMPTLGPARLGGKTYAFDRDGIAHYGMLPVIGQPLAGHCSLRSRVCDLRFRPFRRGYDPSAGARTHLQRRVNDGTGSMVAIQ